MQGRSWMAALTLAAWIVSAGPSPARAADKPEPTTSRVRLDLRIAGLGREGCEVEIKPGHPGCQFRTVTQHVDSRGWVAVVLDDVSTTSADRDCAFAITIREPGHDVRTVKRGLRLPAPNVASGSSLTCYLSSPSKIAKADQSRVHQ